MNGWKEYKLGDIIELIGGGTPKTTILEYWNGDIPWLSVVDFNTGNKYVYSTEKTITPKGLDNSSTKLLEAGDIIISARGTVGALAVLKVPMTFNQSCYGIRRIPTTTDQEFLYYLIKDAIEKFQQIAHGGVFDTITRDTFDQIEIMLPPLPEQRAITGVLSCLDDKIDLLHRQNKTLEGMAEALWRKMFVEEADPGWKKGKLGDIASVSTGKGLKRAEYSENDIYPVIGANGEIGRTGKYLTDEKLILTGRVGTLGEVFISNRKVWISDNVLIIKPNDKTFFYLIYFLLKSIDFENLNVGSTQPLVTQTDLKNIEVGLPNTDSLEILRVFCQTAFCKIEKNENQIRTLSRLRDTLLPRLMSGEVGVKYN